MKLVRCILAVSVAATIGFGRADAERLVILHTNDTHSMIDPDDSDNLGGVLRRKVLIDSVRSVEENVLLVDAGDFVQGTLYFNLYGGEVEQKMMDMLGYDIRILGNHEFDNGAEALAEVLADTKSEHIATNYDLSKSAIAPIFKPYTIRQVGDRRIGFIGLNLNPEGMVSEGNYNGVVYRDAVKAANSAAWWLKNIEKADLVVALTHIGYDPAMPPGDIILAGASEDIDIIIGGHSHDHILPNPSEEALLQPLVANANGKKVVIGQLGKSGKYLGKITVDLDDLSATYDNIRVDSRLDPQIDPAAEAVLAPYRHGVDSLMNLVVGHTAVELPKGGNALLNFAADYVYDMGGRLIDGVDLSIFNKGGLRRSLPKGKISEGMLITLMPFYNYLTVIDIKGRDLLAAFNVMTTTGGNGVSRNVSITFDPEDHECETVIINGEPLDLDRTYRLATIDYLAKGGDYMTPLKEGKVVAKSSRVMYDELINEFRNGMFKGRKIKPSDEARMKPIED